VIFVDEEGIVGRLTPGRAKTALLQPSGWKANPACGSSIVHARQLEDAELQMPGLMLSGRLEDLVTWPTWKSADRS
jgi:hypothetical protein